MEIIKNALGQSHHLIRSVVKPGDIVIDATAGNGHDTAFLAELVGSGGKVYAFDIQEQALQQTRERLAGLKLLDRVELIKDGHQNMDRYVAGKVKAVMFNLGYLPGGDHRIGTRGDTTVAAILKSMDLVEVNGIISIVVYYGGDSGFEEKDRVMDLIRKIDHRQFTVMKTEFVNQVNCPPIFVCIEKLY
ncbi:MAG: class I SAM-dependent methyltransferase [Clostridiales bacterium]|jgi:SAM-dependent methyltransferase|nr:methyltransferase domain-containing protein [Eubacteriales bacterium]MDH7565365.1 class I SAM-dependent methyltransferase [Clostridiales bacterium]